MHKKRFPIQFKRGTKVIVTVPGQTIATPWTGIIDGTRVWRNQYREYFVRVDENSGTWHDELYLREFNENLSQTIHPFPESRS